jgi:hypothetical protein
VTQGRVVFPVSDSVGRRSAISVAVVLLVARAAPGRQLDQIEGTRPTLFLASRRLLNLAAIIPDVVGRPRMGTKVLGGGGILNAVSIAEDHTRHLVGPLSHAIAAAPNTDQSER